METIIYRPNGPGFTLWARLWLGAHCSRVRKCMLRLTCGWRWAVIHCNYLKRTIKKTWLAFYIEINAEDLFNKLL